MPFLTRGAFSRIFDHAARRLLSEERKTRRNNEKIKSKPNVIVQYAGVEDR